MVPVYPVVLEKRSLNGCSSSSSMYGTVCDISIGFSHAFDVGSVLWLLMVSLPWMHDMCLFSGIVVCFCNDFLPSMLWRCWLGGRKGIRPVKNSSGGVLVWLSVWSDVQTCIQPSWCHCHSLSLASVKSGLVLLFWYRLTWVVPE